MNHIVAAITLVLAMAGTSHAESRAVTFFSDGALIETEVAASKGIAEFSIPGGMLEDSLRIRPLGNAVIQRVDIISSRQGGKDAKELESLLEQRSRLEDRLQALATREDIFRSAAKSQSGKAPRKTKTNPDPMQSIRQGTDFAIAQLEAVYTSRRKTEQEIRRLDGRIGAIKKGRQAGDSIARVAIAPRNGRVRVHYALEGVGWTPRYDLRLNNDGNAFLSLYGQLPPGFAGYVLRASHAPLAESNTARILAVAGGSPARLAEYRLPAQDESFGSGVRSSFSVVLANPGNAHLPSGEAALYRNGEYWGRFRFEGISSGRSKKIKFGM